MLQGELWTQTKWEPRPTRHRPTRHRPTPILLSVPADRCSAALVRAASAWGACPAEMATTRRRRSTQARRSLLVTSSFWSMARSSSCSHVHAQAGFTTLLSLCQHPVGLQPVGQPPRLACATQRAKQVPHCSAPPARAPWVHPRQTAAPAWQRPLCTWRWVWRADPLGRARAAPETRQRQPRGRPTTLTPLHVPGRPAHRA